MWTQVHIVKSMAFSVVMHGCESWTIKNDKHRRNDVFKLWCWRKLLRVPWAARRSNQSLLKETNSEYLLEGLMLKLKLQHFGHLMWRTNSLEKTLMLGNIEDKKGMTEDEMVGWHHQLSGLEFEQTPGDSEDREAVLLPSTQSQRVRHDLATEQQQRYACLCVCV